MKILDWKGPFQGIYGAGWVGVCKQDNQKLVFLTDDDVSESNEIRIRPSNVFYTQERILKVLNDEDNPILPDFAQAYQELLTKWFDSPAVPVTQAEKVCTCLSMDLWNFGCRCGGK